MVKISEDSIFPAPREKLWKVLELHLNKDIIGKIHPSILSQNEISKEGNKIVLERVVRVFGRNINFKMKYDIVPMEKFRWEIIESNGGASPGSFVLNMYSDSDEGASTRISTTGEMATRGVPSFLHGYCWEDVKPMG
jgi:hypothetical protein